MLITITKSIRIFIIVKVILSFLISLSISMPGLFGYTVSWQIQKDTSGNLDIEDMMIADHFESMPGHAYSNGFEKDVIWLKTTLDSTYKKQTLWIDNHALALIEVWIAENGQIIEYQKSGSALSVRERSIIHPEHLFQIPERDEKLDIYVRIMPKYEMRFNAMIFPARYTHLTLIRESAFSILPVGIMAALFLIYLIIFSRLGDKRFLIYLFFVGANIISLLNSNGYLFFMLWPDLPVVNTFSPAFDALATITGGLFPIYFLKLRSNFKFGFYAIAAMVALQIVSLIMTIFGMGEAGLQLTFLVAPFFPPIAIFSAIYVWKVKKYELANYYLYGLIIFSVGVILFIGRNLGLISFEAIWLNHILDLAIATEMIMIGVGISKLIDTLRVEKLEADKARMELEQENIRLIRDQNKKLEDLVLKRTKELNEKYNQIALQKEEIESLNESLEEQVRQRTEKLSIQNERLRDYAFFNAHKVRGPLARILGMVALFHNNALEKDQIILNIDSCAKELDKVIKDINNRLSDVQDAN